MPQQLRVPLGKRAMILHLRKQRQPPRQKITAQRHIGLPVILNPGARTFEFDMCIRQASLQERRFGTHDGLCTLTVIAGDFILVRHALVHLSKLALQLTRCAVKHHQHGRRAEGPAAAGLDADRLPRHLRAWHSGAGGSWR